MHLRNPELPQNTEGCSEFPYVVYCPRRGVISHHQSATQAAVARLQLLDTGYYKQDELHVFFWKNDRWQTL